MKLRFAVPAIVLLCCSFAFAQKGGSGGRGGGTSLGQPSTSSTSCTNASQGGQIQVRVAWNNEQSVDNEIIHLRLVSANNVMMTETFADSNGLAYFNSVPSGTYQIKADGPDINETVSETFDVNCQQRMVQQWMHVTPKQNADQKNVPGSGPMVSASELNAPPKAREEIEKSVEALNKGDLKKAEERLRKAISIYPQYARAWNNLGVVLMRENEQPQAIEAFQKSIEVDPKFPSGYLNLARVSMRENKLPDASDLIHKALALNPNDPETLTLLAREELIEGKYENALADARRVHTVPHEHYADAHLIAGDALQHLNRGTEAVKEYELFLKESPDSPNAAQVKAAMAQLNARAQSQPKQQP